MLFKIGVGASYAHSQIQQTDELEKGLLSPLEGKAQAWDWPRVMRRLLRREAKEHSLKWLHRLQSAQSPCEGQCTL